MLGVSISLRKPYLLTSMGIYRYDKFRTRITRSYPRDILGVSPHHLSGEMDKISHLRAYELSSSLVGRIIETQPGVLP